MGLDASFSYRIVSGDVDEESCIVDVRNNHALNSTIFRDLKKHPELVKEFDKRLYLTPQYLAGLAERAAGVLSLYYSHNPEFEIWASDMFCSRYGIYDDEYIMDVQDALKIIGEVFYESKNALAEYGDDVAFIYSAWW